MEQRSGNWHPLHLEEVGWVSYLLGILPEQHNKDLL